ncbi:hypothetical protein H012_gp413 [Acanthamoeba polyphaga moumouvirus]|uniref:Uncharacterized protein n=1 Tax=Acanthamoeba polyphaga moumouvirus TaxID=1269028 RepID=L7RCS1_9VIRU|nr:hypothetical protein H012_gp413 [Acanthamoeba polyphaga moumouvirus]AGC02046.1 hypothetical protein Moumou_00512 [Acanthamoeba polyphaga moumouvirus]AQN68411.1 hypothetical protein [Saudi moumouvirus]
MSDQEFDLTPQIERNMNPFKIIHVYNKTKIYHLTRQVLLDSIITQNTYCFFYHILTKEPNEFNKLYDSFACLIERNMSEADLYVNLHEEAFDHIVNYIQTSKIDGQKIYADNWKKIDEIIDLATILGMSKLVSMLRSLHPTEEEIQEKIRTIKIGTDVLLKFCNQYYLNFSNIDISCLNSAIQECIDRNSHFIEDNIIKPNMYKNDKINISPITEFTTNLLVKTWFR